MRHRTIALALLGTFASASSAIAAPATPATASPGGIGIRLLAAPAAAQSNSLARIYIIGRLAPGASVSRRVEISNTTRSTAEVAVYAAAAAIHRGNFAFAPGHRANQLSSWTSMSRSTLRLGPGDVALDTVSVRVPKPASAAEHFAVVWAEVSQPARAAGGVMLVNRVGVRIYLSVGRRGAAVTDFSIGRIRATRTATGSPLILAIARNSGDRTLTIAGSLTLAGPGGRHAGPFPVAVDAPIPPRSSEDMAVTLDPQAFRGPWRARLRLSSGQIQRTAEATITFPRLSATHAPARTISRSGTKLPIYLAGALFVLLLATWSTILWLRRDVLRFGRRK